MRIKIIQDWVLSSLQPHPLRLPPGGWTAARSAHISYKFWPSLDLCFFAHFVDKAFPCLRCQSKASCFIRPRSDITASSKAFPISLPPVCAWHFPLCSEHGEMSSVMGSSALAVWHRASLSCVSSLRCPGQSGQQGGGNRFWFLNWVELPCKQLWASLRHSHIWFSLHSLSQCLTHPHPEKVHTGELAASVTPSIFHDWRAQIYKACSLCSDVSAVSGGPPGTSRPQHLLVVLRRKIVC